MSKRWCLLILLNPRPIGWSITKNLHCMMLFCVFTALFSTNLLLNPVYYNLLTDKKKKTIFEDFPGCYTNLLNLVQCMGSLYDVQDQNFAIWPSRNCSLATAPCRVVCSNFGHPALTSSFTKYKFPRWKKSFATIVN